MKVCVLASGSKGNATLVTTDKVKILIDAGINYSDLKSRLQNLSVSIDEIDYILITHNHSDHTKALKKICQNHQVQVYLSQSMKNHNDLVAIDHVEYQPQLHIEDLKIRVFRTSHDTDDSFGFIIKQGKKELVYVTDTGYLNEKFFKHLGNKNMYIIESNHDIEMLLNGTYPYHLKKRVLGDKGHLSNNDCGYYLSKLIGENTSHIVLAHLSENNNQPELALETVKEAISDYSQQILVACQNELTEEIEL